MRYPAHPLIFTVVSLRLVVYPHKQIEKVRERIRTRRAKRIKHKHTYMYTNINDISMALLTITDDWGEKRVKK